MSYPSVWSKKKGTLSQDRIDKLEKIKEWKWCLVPLVIIKSFDDNYIELSEWVNQNNKIPSENSKNVIESRLGRWCSRQRANKRNNKLEKENINKLNKIKKWYW